jgi:hypothetical protein
MKSVRAALLGLAAAVAASGAALAAPIPEKNGEISVREQRNGGVIILRISETRLIRKDGDSCPTRYVLAEAARLRAIAAILASTNDKPLLYLEGLGTYVFVRAFGYSRLVGHEVGSGMSVVVTPYYSDLP